MYLELIFELLDSLGSVSKTLVRQIPIESSTVIQQRLPCQRLQAVHHGLKVGVPVDLALQRRLEGLALDLRFAFGQGGGGGEALDFSMGGG